jgi:hypothetical protein
VNSFHHLRRSALFVVLPVAFILVASVRAGQTPTTITPEQNSLAAVSNKRRALLIVFRSGVVDAGNGERLIIDQVLKTDPQPTGRFRWVYGVIAKKLNSYIRKYRSLSAAQDLSDADYVISFNLVEYRRILNTIYPYGELIVIAKGTPGTQTPPRVVWRGKKVVYAGDAIGDLIKELKLLHGES